MTYKTEQENFWAGEFNNDYMNRNTGEDLVLSKFIDFSLMLRSAPSIKSIVELGCNIGLNLQALNKINKNFLLSAYEINKVAASKASGLKIAKIFNKTILDTLPTDVQYDLSFTCGVLMHIKPTELAKVYENLYNLSKKYILIYEYYNPTPVSILYRGYEDRLFKRDFAGELIDKYNLHLVDYGFRYHRDNYFPAGDGTWFLLQK